MEEKKGRQYSIPNIISKLAKIDNARYDMYSEDDIYNEIPKFYFKFMPDTPQKLYDEIKNCVESFQGRLKWTMYHDGLSRRYRIILPQKYSLDKYDNFPTNEKGLFSEKIYRETCEKAIEDLNELALHIKNYFISIKRI